MPPLKPFKEGVQEITKDGKPITVTVDKYGDIHELIGETGLGETPVPEIEETPIADTIGEQIDAEYSEQYGGVIPSSTAPAMQGTQPPAMQGTQPPARPQIGTDLQGDTSIPIESKYDDTPETLETPETKEPEETSPDAPETPETKEETKEETKGETKEETKETPQAPPGVTEKQLHNLTAANDGYIHSDFIGELRPSMLTSGGDEVELTREEDEVNERQIQQQIILANTAWVDRGNKLKINEAQQTYVRYMNASIVNPIYNGDPDNYERLPAWARPSATPTFRPKRKKKQTRQPVRAGTRPGQYDNTYTAAFTESARQRPPVFHSIYSNMDEPLEPDNIKVF